MNGSNDHQAAAQQENYPSLADIVRQETDNGRTIVRFYLDVASGKLDDEGFEVCHRLEAAEQVHAIAPGLVAEYIAKLTGVECNHVIRRRRTRDTTVVPAEASRRSREDGNPSPDADCANSNRARHEALEYLASALAAPSLKDAPRVAGVVRASTDHGKTAVSFLLHVMYGTVRGFRPRQRVEAAKELIAHIARDELRASSVHPGPAEADDPPTTPADSGPAEADDPRMTSVIPAKAGIQGGGDADDPRITSVIPAESLPRTESVHPDPAEEPQISTRNSKPKTQNPPAPERGCYDIDHKIADAQWDPAHPIHKFVQAYDEVAAAFQGEDNEDVHYWISGEVPDSYGKYIWQYAPAHPRSIRRRLRPRRGRRSREPGTMEKGESVWMPRPADKLREAGVPRPNRFKIWI